MIDPKDVTIIIPHLGKTTEQIYSLGECRKSLEETVPTIKRIIATNGNKHPIQYNEYPDHETWIHIKEQGQCKVVSAAVATVNTPWILVTNDDMIFALGWFEKLIAPMTEDILCISPKLIEPRLGAPTFEVYFCGGAGGDFDKQKWLEFAKNYNPMYQDISKIMSKGLCRTGFNLPFLIKKELWDLVQGYDIAYDPFSSNSDSDLEYKIRLAGVQPYQNTNSIVYHFAETSGTSAPENRSYWQKNWDYFISKWGFPRTDDGIWEATFEIPKPPIRKFTPWWEGFYER